MKHIIALCLALCACLCGCRLSGGDAVSDTTVPDAPSNGALSFEDSARLAYYEQLVSELQEEVLSLKTEIYVNRVEYEELLSRLEGGASTDTETDSTTDAIASQFQYTVENGAVTVTSYIGTSKDVVIPERIEDLPVIAIGENAFSGRADVCSVVIPDRVCVIGWFAFSGCVSLETVQIPASVTTISYGAFENCSARMTVLCRSGSYAEQYARSYGIKTGVIPA